MLDVLLEYLLPDAFGKEAQWFMGTDSYKQMKLYLLSIYLDHHLSVYTLYETASHQPGL